MGVGALIAVLAHRGRAHHQRQSRRQEGAELAEEQTPGPVEHEIDGGVVHHLDLGQMPERRAPERARALVEVLEIGVDHAPEVERHGLGVEGGAVVEAHALAQVETVARAAVQHLPGGGQRRPDPRSHEGVRVEIDAGAVPPDQPLEDAHDHALVAAAEGDVGVERGDIALDPIHHATARPRLGVAEIVGKFRRERRGRNDQGRAQGNRTSKTVHGILPAEVIRRFPIEGPPV